MKEKQTFNHKEIAKKCFNAVWDIMDKDSQRSEDLTEMIHLAHTSLWHWTKVEDHTTTNMSVGYWQLSRAYSVAKEFDNALKYAEICIDKSNDDSVGSFYKAFAHEAASRAHLGLLQLKKYQSQLELARSYTDSMTAEEFDLIKKDLEELENNCK